MRNTLRTMDLIDYDKLIKSTCLSNAFKSVTMSSNERLKIILNHLQPSTKNASAKNYKYTLGNNLLTQQQRDFYEENGYLVIRKLIDVDILEQCKQRFSDLCNGKAPRGEMTLMADISLRKTKAEGEYRYYKVQDIIWDDVLEKFVCCDKLLDYVQCFTGPNMYAVHSMLINKPPDVGTMSSRHPMHQDLIYFPFRPSERIVACWTAVDKVTLENGCLFVVPGTHKAALQPHGNPEDTVNKAYIQIQGFDKIQPVNLPMEKGDTVFFHPLLFHGSWPNLSKGFRKCLTVHYASSDCVYIDTERIQEEIGKELIEIYKKKYGFSYISFADTFRMKKRLVRGYAGTLL